MDATAAAVERDVVVGREGELDRIHAFLGRRAELPAGLVIEGPAGAGKTTMWRAGVEAARAAGYLVLSCRPTGSEVQLAHASLSDLFEGHLPGVLSSLPRPQRRALEVALLLEDDGGSPPDRRAVAAGALNALRALAREQPVLLAIDDTQWVDAPSAEVIEFALRRLGTAPVATLASRRIASATAPSPTSAGVRPERALERPVERVEAGPLSLGAVQRILRTRTSIDANRRMLQRIHETSGGNPFYALELARSLGSDGAAARTSASGEVEPLSIGGDLGDLLADRLDGLGSASRDVLFVAASLSQPTLGGMASATGWTADAVVEALRPGIDASVVRLNHEAIEFGHPLLATAAYNALDVGERRRWHARIAAASDDPETAARHLALAGSGPDAQVSERLVIAARSAGDRGAPTAACDLYTEALARLPGAMAAERAALVAEMAPILMHAGRADQARPLVEATIAQLDGGPLRCDL